MSTTTTTYSICEWVNGDLNEVGAGGPAPSTVEIDDGRTTIDGLYDLVGLQRRSQRNNCVLKKSEYYIFSMPGSCSAILLTEVPDNGGADASQELLGSWCSSSVKVRVCTSIRGMRFERARVTIHGFSSNHHESPMISGGDSTIAADSGKSQFSMTHVSV